jgi:hypothetical protein
MQFEEGNGRPDDNPIPPPIDQFGQLPCFQRIEFMTP